jgi:serine/threonine protein kinase
MQLSTAIQLSEALARLHRLNIIHRDVSVCNVMRTPGGVMKLADFGISTMCEKTLRITNGSVIQGNVPYMAPEQGNADAQTTDRADVWSFAATMLEAWTGALPYGNLNQYQVLRQHFQGKPPPLDLLDRPLPPQLKEILQQCFQVDPTKRPSAAELRNKFCQAKTSIQQLRVCCRAWWAAALWPCSLGPLLQAVLSVGAYACQLAVLVGLQIQYIQSLSGLRSGSSILAKGRTAPTSKDHSCRTSHWDLRTPRSSKKCFFIGMAYPPSSMLFTSRSGLTGNPWSWVW